MALFKTCFVEIWKWKWNEHEFVYVWAVSAADALEKDEGAEGEDADGSKDVPSLATVEHPAQEEAVFLVGKVSDKNGWNTVRYLTRKKDDSCISVVEFKNLKMK